MMQTVLLDKDKHDRNRFNCGIEALNNYLKVMASNGYKVLANYLLVKKLSSYRMKVKLRF